MDRINNSDLSPLDSNYNDIELLEKWNEVYDKYGCMMDPFIGKWEREFIINDLDSSIETTIMKNYITKSIPKSKVYSNDYYINKNRDFLKQLG